ncbi:hypothetical protein Bca4012_081711 [Brassica carinata]
MSICPLPIYKKKQRIPRVENVRVQRQDEMKRHEGLTTAYEVDNTKTFERKEPRVILGKHRYITFVGTCL